MGSIADYQEFFVEYDRQTHPFEIPNQALLSANEKQQRVQIVTAAANPLHCRVWKRQEKFKVRGGSLPNPVGLPAFSLPPSDVAYIANVQQTLFRLFFGQTLNMPEFIDAFSMFANGELRITTSNPTVSLNCEPNSADIFCFAEFAFVVLEMQNALTASTTVGRLTAADIQMWQDILPTFVMIQEIFASAYQPPMQGPDWDANQLAWYYEAYRSSYQSVPQPRLPGIITQIQQKYAIFPQADLEKQAAVNANAAFGMGSHNKQIC